MTALTFDDVLIAPGYSEVESRLAPDTSTILGLEVPLISANMDTVTGPEMAIAMDKAGGMGVLHRFMPKDELLDAVAQVREQTPEVAVSVGIGSSAESFVAWCDVLIDAGVTTLVLDVAHGHQKRVMDCLVAYGDRHATMIAGNVATHAGAGDLQRSGADYMKVGIGPGAACTTRKVTGVGVPQLSAILDTRDYPIIADGGVKNTDDFCKAIAAGADAVMCGSLFAGCTESPGEVCFPTEFDKEHGKPDWPYKIYRGSSSAEARADFELKPHIPEGETGYVPWTGPVAETVAEYKMALQASMSYVGAMTIAEYQAKAEFIEVTPTSLVESGARI